MRLTVSNDLLRYSLALPEMVRTFAWKVLLLITMQYPLGIPPNLRTNIDYVFILREPYLTNRKRIWENYASMFPTLESFCAVMDQTTENFECLVIKSLCLVI